MFASNFTVADSHLKHVRGQENLKTFAESKTIGSAAFPGVSFLRLGTVDDFSLHETKLRPTVEQFVKDRVSWVQGIDGIKKFDAMGEY